MKFLLAATLLAALSFRASAGSASDPAGTAATHTVTYNTLHHDSDEMSHREELRQGHMDLLVLYEESEGLHMALAADDHDHDHDHDHDGDEHSHETEDHGEEADDHDHDHEHGEHEELDHVEIVGGPKAVNVTPGGAAWSFLGGADRYTYILPQSQIDGLPFLGFSSEELDAGQFQSGPVVTLTSIDGPGHFVLYQVDAFAQPIVYMDTGDAAVDSYAIPLGTHVHMNWAFSAPGEYTLTFEVSATMTGGTVVTSAPQEVAFHIVGQPTYLYEGHADIGLHYEEDHGLEFFVAGEHEHGHDEGEEHDDDHDHGHEEEHDDHDHDHEHGEELHPADVTVLLGGYAVAEVPDTAAYSFLGAPGSKVYLIGQQEEDGVPFVGWSTEELDSAVFSSDIAIELHSVSGPGEAYLYAVDTFGEVTVIWDSVDAAEDVLTIPVGTHSHLNLAVTAPGTYTLELHAEADLTAGGEAHAETTVTLQAGGLEGYYGDFFRPMPYWLWVDAWLYTSGWPWLWSAEQGWLAAEGDGGPNHIYFRSSDESWLWTSSAAFPYFWSFAAGDWLLWDGAAF